ncbi:hypothetical protein [Caballeronia sp. ATUFL_M1_KS5A]|uniref:hypothetical protein n=1 Tax=Caballeronia sp. ATUFL_M1_KS5A TaxID=2921778 RepID=UPI002027979F|nr:hypothetical protein [Caballeronia sp. ATUFL_M1_KS5A]
MGTLRALAHDYPQTVHVCTLDVTLIAVARHRISDYDQTAGQRRVYRDCNDGKQSGDPAKAVT